MPEIPRLLFKIEPARRYLAALVHGRRRLSVYRLLVETGL
jgi:hypothetical protein